MKLFEVLQKTVPNYEYGEGGRRAGESKFVYKSDPKTDVAEVERSPEFKAVAELAEYVPTNTIRSHGAMRFLSKNRNRAYTVRSASGYLSITGVGQPTNKYPVRVPELTATDRVENLKRLLKRLEQHIKKTEKPGEEWDLVGRKIKLTTAGAREWHKITERWEGSFYCGNMNLTSLKGAPRTVTGSFNCRDNKLTSLKYAPEEVGGSFTCSDNKLESLEGIHKILKQMNGSFTCAGNKVKSHVLGLLYVKGLKRTIFVSDLISVEMMDLNKILNKHLPNTKGHAGVLACQSELLDAGLEEYAKL